VFESVKINIQSSKTEEKTIARLYLKRRFPS